MKIPKAIEILEAEITGYRPFGRGLVREANQLGIEALKREWEHRGRLRLTRPELLPGETKD